MRTCTLRCALITAGLLALAGLSGAATGTAGAAGPGSTTSATSTANAASAPAAAGHPSAAAAKAPAAKTPAPKASAAPPLIDINSAGRKQLKAALPGLSEAQIDKLIASRPYLSKAELVSKAVIPEGTYLSIKGLIIAKQPPQPKAKAKGA